MKFTGKPIDHRKWNEVSKLLKENSDALDAIDKAQKDKGELLWRYIQLPRADGYAVYQITKINKTTAVLESVEGVAADDYMDEVLGEKGSMSLARVRQLVEGRDRLNELFSNKK